MTLRAKGARKRRGSSPRRKEEGTVKVCPEAGRERRLMYGHLGAPARAAVNRERRALAAGSRAFIKDAGRRFAAIPHIRPGHADLAARGTCPADPRRAPTSREGSAMAERFVGIDVALREHRIAVLDRDGIQFPCHRRHGLTALPNDPNGLRLELLRELPRLASGNNTLLPHFVRSGLSTKPGQVQLPHRRLSAPAGRSRQQRYAAFGNPHLKYASGELH